MALGGLYASSLKSVALCLLYAPLWPAAYLLTAVLLPRRPQLPNLADCWLMSSLSVRSIPRVVTWQGALMLNFIATKFAVAKWWARPPMVSEEMMEKMRSRLGFLMLLHTAVSAIGATAASSSTADVAFGPVLAMFVLWLLYAPHTSQIHALHPAPCCFRAPPPHRAHPCAAPPYRSVLHVWVHTRWMMLY